MVAGVRVRWKDILRRARWRLSGLLGEGVGICWGIFVCEFQRGVYERRFGFE